MNMVCGHNKSWKIFGVLGPLSPGKDGRVIDHHEAILDVIHVIRRFGDGLKLADELEARVVQTPPAHADLLLHAGRVGCLRPCCRLFGALVA